MFNTKKIILISLISLFIFSCDSDSNPVGLQCDEGLIEVDGECVDECGVPDGDNSTCTDECGVVNGNTIEECGSCEYVYLWGQCYNIEGTWSIDRNYSNLTGEIPPEIGKLINLTELFLNNNQLSGEIPSDIGNLNLTFLNLNSNQLTGEIPLNICNLDMNWGGSYDYDEYFTIYDNQLCPPYPECIQDYVGEQDTSDCP